ncbi:MAG: hypothetical protein OXQ96_05705, partial [Alphaproteobacteria bacterium]|nr:hypothetical protein [Alphaproteobacteria bacterium]
MVINYADLSDEQKSYYNALATTVQQQQYLTWSDQTRQAALKVPDAYTAAFFNAADEGRDYFRQINDKYIYHKETPIISDEVAEQVQFTASSVETMLPPTTPQTIAAKLGLKVSVFLAGTPQMLEDRARNASIDYLDRISNGQEYQEAHSDAETQATLVMLGEVAGAEVAGVFAGKILNKVNYDRISQNLPTLDFDGWDDLLESAGSRVDDVWNGFWDGAENLLNQAIKNPKTLEVGVGISVNAQLNEATGAIDTIAHSLLLEGPEGETPQVISKSVTLKDGSSSATAYENDKNNTVKVHGNDVEAGGRLKIYIDGPSAPEDPDTYYKELDEAKEWLKEQGLQVDPDASPEEVISDGEGHTYFMESVQLKPVNFGSPSYDPNESYAASDVLGMLVQRANAIEEFARGLLNSVGGTYAEAVEDRFQLAATNLAVRLINGESIDDIARGIAEELLAKPAIIHFPLKKNYGVKNI